MATTTRSRALPVLPGPECCPTGLTQPLDRTTAESLAGLLKAVADPARLQLLALLRASDAGEACVCDLTEPLGLSQPTVSHHLKVLTDAGLLTRERRGTWSWCAVVPERLAEIANVFVAAGEVRSHQLEVPGLQTPTAATPSRAEARGRSARPR